MASVVISMARVERVQEINFIMPIVRKIVPICAIRLPHVRISTIHTIFKYDHLGFVIVTVVSIHMDKEILRHFSMILTQDKYLHGKIGNLFHET